MTVNTIEQKRIKFIDPQIRVVLNHFVNWLENFGDLSQDHYDFWANLLGQKAKMRYYRKSPGGAIAVAPFALLDVFLPSSRKWFRSPQRFPIADAHYSMGFAALFNATGEERFYQKALHFVKELEKSRCPKYSEYTWGYPFDWMTNAGLIPSGTPLITTIPYVYEAYAAVHEIDENDRWQSIMRSISEHVAKEYADEEIGENVRVCSYTSKKQMGKVRFRHVVNANSYRAFMLTEAAQRFNEAGYRRIAEANLNYVLQSQQADGSWLYATDGSDPFIDHFHTCFVLKNLIKIERLIRNQGCAEAIGRGIEFYLKNLFDSEGLPKPFAKTQRFTLYRRELYDYAESLNLALLLRENDVRFKELIDILVNDLIVRWQKPDGSFRTRQLYIGWNNVPYHRWAQSQVFRSLSLLLQQ